MGVCATILVVVALTFDSVIAVNTTFNNPILPGFHPDPSCIFVPELDDTFFCASSSFNAFPGIPIHASKDLRTWKLVSNALNRLQQLPALSTTNRSTGGIWAPTLRYHEALFYLTTTLVFDDRANNDSSRWDNFLLTTADPFNSSAWSDPLHFDYLGYDSSLFWSSDGEVIVTGAHPWRVWPGITQASINLTTGETGPVRNPWNGTGGLAPEGPHIYERDGFYYLLLAEGGTGENHMVTMARSTSIDGPYKAAPSNPLLSNANTSSYFQAVGHADLFQDGQGNWWSAALSVRSGPEYKSYPMGRETILTAVSWPGGDFPQFTHVEGIESGWPLTQQEQIKAGEGQLVDANDDIQFEPGSQLPPHFLHWRLPVEENYQVSPPGHDNSLQMTSSELNLTAYDGYYTRGKGQSFVGRRQTHTLFEFSVEVDFSELRKEEEETGISLFLVQRYHFDIGVVQMAMKGGTGEVMPHIRFRGISGTDANNTNTMPLSDIVTGDATKLRLQIRARNETHYEFTAGPVGNGSPAITLGYCMGSQLSWGFTGTLVGAYATTNGREGKFNTWFNNWLYTGLNQVRY